MIKTRSLSHLLWIMDNFRNIDFAATQPPQARLAQSVERETLNLKVVGSTPTLGTFLPGWH